MCSEVVRTLEEKSRGHTGRLQEAGRPSGRERSLLCGPQWGQHSAPLNAPGRAGTEGLVARVWWRTAEHSARAVRAGVGEDEAPVQRGRAGRLPEALDFHCESSAESFVKSSRGREQGHNRTFLTPWEEFSGCWAECSLKGQRMKPGDQLGSYFGDMGHRLL